MCISFVDTQKICTISYLYKTDKVITDWLIFSLL